jgi:hypothetical protein
MVQIPVAFRIARHAAQVLRASGKFIREDRKDAELAKQTLRDLCVLAIFSRRYTSREHLLRCLSARQLG